MDRENRQIALPIEKKKCTYCMVAKTLDYYIGINGKTTRMCATCRARDRRRVRTPRPADQARENSRVRRARHPERVLQQKQRYRDTHKEGLAEKAKRYREEHRGRLGAYSAWNNAKRKSERDGLEFSLSLDDFEKARAGVCYWCGHDRATGFDRLDNARGYTLENAVPACKCCNAGKNAGTQEEWVARCQRVAERHGAK